MTRGMSESIFFWLTLARAAVPPRDPNDGEDEEGEEDGGDEDDDREPAGTRRRLNTSNRPRYSVQPAHVRAGA